MNYSVCWVWWRVAACNPNGCYLSNRQIAKHVGVDAKTVAVIRRDLEASGKIRHIATREGLDGKQHPAHHIQRPKPLFDTLRQAVENAGADQIPVVMHSPNRPPWVVILRLGDLPKLIECINQSKTSDIGFQASEDKSNPEV